MPTDSKDMAFQIERKGDVTILRPAPEVETLGWELVEHATELVLQPIRGKKSPLVTVDLSGVQFFGSVFLSMLLRLWKQITSKGGTMVLCGASPRARELLRITALDTLWAIYDTRQEALQVLQSE